MFDPLFPDHLITLIYADILPPPTMTDTYGFETAPETRERKVREDVLARAENLRIDDHTSHLGPGEWPDDHYARIAERKRRIEEYQVSRKQIAEAKANAPAPGATANGLKARTPRRLNPLVDPVDCGVYKLSKDDKPVLSNNGLVTYLERSGVICHDRHPYIYNGKFYRLLSDEELMSALDDARRIACPDFEQPRATVYESIIKIYKTGHDVSEYLSGNWEGRERYEPIADLVPFENGLLNTTTLEFLPHTPFIFLTRTMACEYDPKVTSHKMEKVIEDIVPDPATREFIYEAMGYTMLSNRIITPALFCLYGGGGTGKSTLVNAMIATIGSDVCSYLGINEITYKFNICMMRDKQANFCTETENDARGTGRSSVDGAILKKLMTGETVNDEEKNKKATKLTPTAKLWFNTNSIPHFGAMDGGLERRIYAVLCNEKQSENHEIEDMVAKDKTMRQWLVNKCLISYITFLDRGGRFEVSEAMQGVKTDIVRSESTYDFFCEKYNTTDRNEIARKLNGEYVKALYAEYEEFCDEGNRPKVTSYKFSNKITLEFRVQKGSSPITMPDEVCVAHGFHLGAQSRRFWNPEMTEVFDKLA